MEQEVIAGLGWNWILEMEKGDYPFFHSTIETSRLVTCVALLYTECSLCLTRFQALSAAVATQAAAASLTLCFLGIMPKEWNESASDKNT